MAAFDPIQQPQLPYSADPDTRFYAGVIALVLAIIFVGSTVTAGVGFAAFAGVIALIGSPGELWLIRRTF